MKRFLFLQVLLILLLFVPTTKGAQSLSAGYGVSPVLPTSSPWNANGAWRIEFRLHGSYTQSPQGVIYNSASYAIRTFSGSVNMTSWDDGSGQCSTTGVPDGTDAIFRFQRFLVAGVATLTAEAWNSQTGLVLSSTTCTMGMTGTTNDSGFSVDVGAFGDSTFPFNGDIAFERLYTTVVSIGTLPGNTTCVGDYLDFELESNGNDCSGHAENLTMTGASYVTTPTYNPAAGFNPYPTLNTFSTLSNLQLTSTSFSATDNSTLTYVWSQVAPIPASGSFSSTTVANPTFSSSTVGTYGIQVIVTDNALNSTTVSNTHIGAVATIGACPSTAINAYNCIVSDGLSTKMHNILGPLVIGNSTANPWIYGYTSEIPTLQNIAAIALQSPYAPALGTQIAGCTVQSGGSTASIVGTGTCNFTSLTTGEWLTITWNSVDGSGTGRGQCQANTIIDATHLNCGGAQYYSVQSGLSIYRMPVGGINSGCSADVYILCWTGIGQPNQSWHYYDVALAFYRLYYITGDSQYLTAAQQMADYVWQWVLDHGYSRQNPPRNMSMISQYYRALELGGSSLTNRMAGLAITAGTLNADYTNIPNIDLRDGVAYPLMFNATGAATDPDATQHSIYCAYLTNANTIATLVTKQNANGGYSEREYVQNPSYVDAPKAFSLPLIWEGAGWRQSLNLGADEISYGPLADTNTSTGCNQPTLAASLLTVIQNYAGWIYNYTRAASGSGARGVFYENDSASNDQATIFNPAGTVSVTNGSTALVGVGTHFVSAGYVTNQPFIGLQTPRTIYKINSCVDDTHCTLNIPYGSLYGEIGNDTGDVYSVTSPAVACGAQSSSTWCYNGIGDRNLTRTMPGKIAWIYNQTGNTQYQTWATELYSATVGGPTTGLTINSNLYNSYLPCTGPACDGYVGDASLGAATCGNPGGTTTPCNVQQSGVQNILTQLSKGAGEAWGAPGMDNALAWDLNPSSNLGVLNLTGKIFGAGKLLVK